MGSLGDLWFGVGLKDQIKDNEINRMRKRIEKGLSESVTPSVDVKRLAQQLRGDLRSETFQIKVDFDDEALKRKLRATVGSISGTKFSASDLRAVRASALLAQSEEKLAGMRQQTRQRTANAEAAEQRLAAARTRTEAANIRLKQAQESLNRAMRDGVQSYGLLNSTLAKVGGVVAIEELARNIVKTTGDFQFMQAAIVSLVGSEREGVELMEKLKDFARISPLEVRDVTKAAQTLLGFNVELEKVPDMIQRIGDVSMGNKERFNALTLAFAQTTSAARLTGEDLRQYVNAGFNPLQQIAEKTGKSMRELKDEMSKGAISVQMVEQAFIDATSEGGKFYNMSQKQAETINGQLAKLRDTIDRTFNEIGSSHEGEISAAISITSKLIENYEQVGRVLIGLLTTYGAYRTGVMLATVAENGHSLAMMLVRLRIIATQRAQALLNATMLANPYVLAATALGTLAGVLIATSDGLTAAERAQKNFNDAMAEGAEKQKEYNAETEKAIGTANNDAEATDARRTALNLLISRYGDIMQKYIDEKGHLKDILQLKKEIAIIDGNRNVEDLTAKAKRYSDAAEAARSLIMGKKLTATQQKLIADVKNEYFDKNSWWAKAWYNDNDLLQWAQGLAGNYGKKARREAAQNAATRFQDVIAGMTDGQLEALQKILRTAKREKGNVILKAYKELENVTLTQEDIDKLTTYAGGVIEARKPKARTKKVIEDDKKAAQQQLEALTVAEANGKKGAALRKKILDYDRELEAYNAKAHKKSGTTAGESAEKLAGMQLEQALKIQRATKDMEFATRRAELNAQEDSTAKAVHLIELDKEQRLEAIRREYEDLRTERIKAAKAMWDADPKKKGVNFYESEAYKTAASDSKYTQAERDNKAAKEKEALADYYRALDKVRQGELQAMRDYLKEYGSLEQQRLAITEEYEEKIRKAQHEGERLRLKQELARKKGQLTFENISKGIDWHSLFNGIGAMSRQMMQQMMGQLHAYVNTDEYRQSGAENQQKVEELIKELRAYLGTSQGESWQNLAKAMEDFNRSVMAYEQAQKADRAANQQLEQARQSLSKDGMTDDERRQAQQAYETARENAANMGRAAVEARKSMEAFGQKLNMASDAVVNYTSKLDVALKNATGWKGVSGFGDVENASKMLSDFKGNVGKELADQLTKLGRENGVIGKGNQDRWNEAREAYQSGEITEEELQGLQETMESGFAKATGKLGDFMGSLGNGLSNILSSGIGQMVGFWLQIPRMILQIADTIKNFVTGILDSFTELLEFEWLSDLVVSITDAIGNLIDAIFDLPENLLKSLEGIVVNGVGGLVNNVLGRVGNVLSLGALSSKGPSDWFTNSNEAEVQKTIDRLTEANGNLEKSTDRLTEKMGENNGIKSVEAYEKAVRAQQKHTENQREMLDAEMGYHSAHHSNWYYWGLNANDYAKVNAALREYAKTYNKTARTVSSGGDIIGLSPEELDYLRTYYQDIWQMFLDQGKYDKSEWWEALADEAGKIDELTASINENLTQTSFSSLRDSYVDALMDMSKTTEDFSKDFKQYMMKALLNFAIGDKMDERLKAWYNSWGETMREQGELSATQIENYRKQWDDMVNQGIQERDRLAQLTGYEGDGNNSSTSSKVIQGGFTEQETGLALSYWNAMRADLSMMRPEISGIHVSLDVMSERMNVLANVQITQLQQIAANTFRNAEAADKIYDILRMARNDRSFGLHVK